MLEKKVFVYSTDNTISIIEAIFNYDDYTVKVLRKKSYLKSKFFEVHSKVLQQLLATNSDIDNIDLKTNLLNASEIYKLILEYASRNPNCVVQGKYTAKEDDLKRTYRLLIDSNFKDISFQDNVTQKRILSELKQKIFDDISDRSFLIFINSLPKKIEVRELSMVEQWESKQAETRNAVEPIFGGPLTNRGIKDIFL